MAAFEPKSPGYRAATIAMFDAQPAMRTLGVMIVRLSPGEVELAMLHSAAFTQQNGFIHAGIHTALTPLVYLVLVPGSLLIASGIALGEFVLHYHIDWAKEQITKRNGWTAQNAGFWHALGTDQLIHGLTYLGIVAVLIATAAAT